jgi:hypothetical protein
MADPVVQGVSSELTDEDSRKRDLVKTLMTSENKAIAEFAKHLVTVAFSAIGVVLALKDKWLDSPAPFQQRMLLGIALVLFLAAALTSSLAAGVYGHRISLSDYEGVDAELHRVAMFRHRLTNLGLIFIAAATVVVVLIAL